MPRTIKSLTVKQLIERLTDLPPDALVVLTSDYGDHCHTEQALAVEDVEELTIREGAYSSSGWIVPEIDDEDEDDEDDEPSSKTPTLQVVALRSHMPSRY